MAILSSLFILLVLLILAASLMILFIIVLEKKLGFFQVLKILMDLFFYSRAVILLFIVAMYHLYFILLELLWGATIGKYLLGLKVISEDGGFLPPSAIYTRNLIRFIEVWIPLVVFGLLGMSLFEKTLLIVALCFCTPLVLFPWLDKKRRRVGDVLAGTLVVTFPKVHLERDLAEEEALEKEKKVERAKKEVRKEKEKDFVFTQEMLDIYGEKELDVLDTILRNLPNLLEEEKASLLEKLVQKITEKIGYREPIAPEDYERFVLSFYRAHRKHLEDKLVRGESLERRTRRLKKLRKQAFEE